MLDCKEAAQAQAHATSFTCVLFHALPLALHLKASMTHPEV